MRNQVSSSLPQPSPWQVLLRLRWLIGAAVALAFALGQLIEALVAPPGQARLLFDVVAWGLLGGVTAWLCLTWASRQERRYQAGSEQALQTQQRLNEQLQRANAQLNLLSQVNHQIAESATLDEILDAALAFPQRLVPATAAALLLHDAAGALAIRAEGAGPDELAQLRAQFAIAVDAEQRHARTYPQKSVSGWPAVSSDTADCRLPTATSAGTRPGAAHEPAACLVLPLHNGNTLVGWIELYLARRVAIPADELALLETIASELAEAIVSARRRTHEERALYELDRAIAEERARIARDIHDGIAQTLAFHRMRIDLWLDWLEADRPRLRGELLALKQQLREQIADLRRAIFALRPLQFDELGFVGGLQRYISEFAGQHGWQASIDLSDLPTGLRPDVEAACFRIVQEALTNVAKHAGARRVSVIIDRADQGLRLRIHDDGRGFDPSAHEAGSAGRLGLRQMRERLAVLGGRLLLQAQPGAGAEVCAWLPLT